MAYAPHVMRKRAYQRFKQVFRSKLYAGEIGLIALIRHWLTVRKIAKGRAVLMGK